MSALSELYKEIAACQRCDLARYRTNTVPGEGAEHAEIMFIGEAPGWHEDQQGRPFVGPAGQYLEQLLASIGLKRQQVYITNVIKDRPPGNRDPLPGEIASCRDWLNRQMRGLPLISDHVGVRPVTVGVPLSFRPAGRSSSIDRL